ncbi:MAG: protein kinase, partial [Acidobacteriota bacterium]|nr:protein kinase [Acidobacteriota bacterium]
MTLSNGTRIGVYEIVGPLGAGGMGVVYRARDTHLDRFVALKVVGERDHVADTARQRLLREARTASSLNHPYICTIYEAGEADGETYIAMEVVEGRTLSELIGREGLPIETAIRYGAQIADALAHAHERGVVHRDLKSANVIVTPEGRPKVLDFGLAKRAVEASTEEATRTETLTAAGTVVGTITYMAPEVLRGLPTDARSDLWALGVMLYQAVTGTLPFRGSSAFEITSAILRDSPAPLPAHVSSGLRAIIQRLLAKQAGERYQRASEVCAALEAIQPDVGAPVVLVSRWRWAGALVAAVLLAVAGFFTWRALSPPRSINSVVILPLRTLSQETTESFLGLGIADALITKIGQTGQLQVRPISAVRKYAKEDSDPLEAARHLNADTVLAGSLQQSGNRIRVSVQLLRTTTGETLWAQSFDVQSGDVFTVQDEIARQVAGQLSLKLDAGQRRDFEKRSTANPQAFELYSKALYHLGNRMRSGEVPLAIELLKKAVELDPNYALARARLGYAYAVYGVFYRDDPAIIDLATKQLTEAEKLDPRIAQIHVARSVILFSRHSGWKLREAILEGRAAHRLDPNTGDPDLAYYYDHIGLEALATKHRYAALRSDPDNEYYKQGLVAHYYGFMLADEGAAAEQKLFRHSPNVEFYLIKGLVNEAAPLVEKENAANPGSSFPRTTNLVGRVHRAQVYALQQNFAAAATEIAALEVEAEKAPRVLPFHHTAYGIAKVRARLGDSPRALHWLQITVDSGWPNYVMMARDRMLDPVRN